MYENRCIGVTTHEENPESNGSAEMSSKSLKNPICKACNSKARAYADGNLLRILITSLPT